MGSRTTPGGGDRTGGAAYQPCASNSPGRGSEAVFSAGPGPAVKLPRPGARITLEEYRALVGAAMSEDELLVEVQRLLTLGRWRWHHVRRSDAAIQQGDPGFPDIVAVRRDRLVVAELKAETGRYRTGQPEWLAAFAAAGAETFTWRPRDLAAITEVLR